MSQSSLQERPKITALVQTYNADRMLAEVFEALKGFDELLVCDMYSTDRTLEIAAQYGARVVMHDYAGGILEPAKNFAIQSAAHEWVLMVDADEIVPDALKEYIRDFVVATADQRGYVALQIPFYNHFMGLPVRAEYPDYHIRLVRKSKAKWPTDRIHARPEIDGEVFVIPKKRKDLAIRHYTNPTLSNILQKQDLYSDKEAERRSGKQYSVCGARLRCWHRFFKAYVLKGGFRDGKVGYIHARMMANYKFLTIAKLWERQGLK